MSLFLAVVALSGSCLALGFNLGLWWCTRKGVR